MAFIFQVKTIDGVDFSQKSIIFLIQWFHTLQEAQTNVEARFFTQEVL